MNRKQAKKLRILNSIKLRDAEYDISVTKVYKVQLPNKDGNLEEQKIPRFQIKLKEGTSKAVYRQLKKENKTVKMSLKEAYATRNLLKSNERLTNVDVTKE